MEAYNVSGVLVLKDGKVVLERYGLGRKPDDRWTSFSVAKSVTSTLVGAAIQDGKIKSLDDPGHRLHPRAEGLGLRRRHRPPDPDDELGREVERGLHRPQVRRGPGRRPVLEPGVNPMVSYMRRLPRANPPGTKFNYNTGETDLVGVLVSKAIGKSLAQYASEKIWKPYGMEQDAIWMVDPAGQERGGCCISMTLRDYAPRGPVHAGGGKAGGKQIVPAGWIAEATRRRSTTAPRAAGYGYFWWIARGGAYEASGIFGQSITTFRDERLIIVINSAWPTATGRELSVARIAFINAVRAAAKGL